MIFGTRPEAIKMAPVFHALNKFPDLSVQVCATGQHREMLDQVITLFDIPITIDLQVMTEGQDLFSLTSLLLMKLRPVLDDFSPDCILVHGDTKTQDLTHIQFSNMVDQFVVLVGFDHIIISR